MGEDCGRMFNVQKLIPEAQIQIGLVPRSSVSGFLEQTGWCELTESVH